jgi:hypothetical protein
MWSAALQYTKNVRAAAGELSVWDADHFIVVVLFRKHHHCFSTKTMCAPLLVSFLCGMWITSMSLSLFRKYHHCFGTKITLCRCW